MKCDELESYYYYEDRVFTPATHTYRVYHADEVDAAIAELKDKLQLDEDEMAGFLQLEEECGGGDLRNYIEELKAENERLKQALKDNGDNAHGLFKDAAEVDEAIAELRAKLEDVEASAYADSVDAWASERRLQRALWLARAERAEAEHAHWATIWFCDTKIVLNINKSSVSQDPYKSNTFKNASKWRNMWYDIASKCLKKAEEYK